jgi:hypothetical protein
LKLIFLDIKNTLDLDQDSKQIQNTLTNKEIENMLIDLKSKSKQYSSQVNHVSASINLAICLSVLPVFRV